MAWQDKTLEAKYTSPSGKEYYFTWDEKLSRETELKTGIFTFPDRDGAHVQHQGAGATTFPMKCVFSGPDCMDQADEFEEALFERDVAELQHPVYGIIKVIPTGNVKREDDLVSALNESHVTVSFTETITDESPTELEAVTAAEIDEKYEEFSEAAAADFAEGLSVDTVAEAIQLESVLEAEAQFIDDNLSGLASVDAGALANFKTTSGELKSVIKELKKDHFAKIKNLYNDVKEVFKKTEKFVTKALNAARLSLHLMKLPSRMAVNIMEKIKGYSQLIAAIVNQFKNDPYGINNAKNAFISTGLVLTGCVASIASGTALSIATAAASSSGGFSASRSIGGGTAGDSGPTWGSGSGSGGGSGGGDDSGSGSGSGGSGGGGDSGSGGGGVPGSGGSAAGGPSGSVVDGGGTISREESIQIMNQLIAMFETVKSFQDYKIGNDIIIDSNSNSYLLLNELVYSSIQLIQAASFSLPMQRSIRLDRDRQIIELCCELYGSADYLDKFIAENDFNIDEIELLPMGREVTYYVQSA
jgi:hypothetical protein